MLRSFASSGSYGLRAGISALSPTYRANGNYLRSIPAVDIASDGLLHQVPGLLAITSTDHQGRHFQTWLVLNWPRHNVLRSIKNSAFEIMEGTTFWLSC